MKYGKFSVYSLGCKVNQYEGQGVIALLKSRGCEAEEGLKLADYYIINTCSVTMEADKKSRQAVARALKLNPGAKVFIMGCSSQNDASRFSQKEGVYLVGGTFGKIKTVEDILSLIDNGDSIDSREKLYGMPDGYEDDLSPFVTGTRGSVKIQDGCNNFCSYCIVPYLRGRSRSRRLDSVVEEAKKVAEITREIVLTGINISDYNVNGGGLTELIKSLYGIRARFRFGSLECGVITTELLTAMKGGNFCDHFHLSMQSGSDEVLKKMNRHYTVREFLGKIELIRSFFPDAGITTDVICGFPTETEENFRDTERTVISAGFSDMHIFPYSFREGTAAAKLGRTDMATAIKRTKQLETVRDRLKEQFILSQLGKRAEIYVEEAAGEFNTGYTSNYIRAYTDNSVQSLVRQILDKPYRDGVTTRPVN